MDVLSRTDRCGFVYVQELFLRRAPTILNSVFLDYQRTISMSFGVILIQFRVRIRGYLWGYFDQRPVYVARDKPAEVDRYLVCLETGEPEKTMH